MVVWAIGVKVDRIDRGENTIDKNPSPIPGSGSGVQAVHYSHAGVERAVVKGSHHGVAPARIINICKKAVVASESWLHTFDYDSPDAVQKLRVGNGDRAVTLRQGVVAETHRFLSVTEPDVA